MARLTADEIITYKHVRSFIQFGAGRPNNPVAYAGQDAQYMSVEGVGLPESGGIEPAWVPDPVNVGQYRLVARKITPPDLASATLRLAEKHGAIPRQLQRIGCAFNLYNLHGKCKDLSDFLAGWSDYVLVYSGALVTDKDLGTRSTWDSDEMLEDSLALVLADIYPVGGLAFGEAATTEIDREVMDVTYGSEEQCGDCGPQDDGTKRIYAVTKSSGAGSPGLPAEVVYSLDGGATHTQINIDGIGATADPSAIAIVGSRLVVLVPSEDAYYWSDLNPETGVPGTFTKVTTGFVAAGSPNDMYVAGPREIYFAGDGGYVYKSTDITAGVSVISAGTATSSNLARIDGLDETIVAVGASGAVIKSINRGATFSLTTTSPSADNCTAVEVLDTRRFWVGTDGGDLFYTLNGGETWVTQSFSGQGTGAVRDVVFATDEVGYFAHNTATPAARLFSTWNGGADWTRTSPRILNLPTFDYVGRIAVPNVHAGVAANNVALAGLGGNGSDGILLYGVASRL